MAIQNLRAALATGMALLCVLSCSAMRVQAGPIGVPNFSFEFPLVNPGTFTGEIDDWTDIEPCCDGVFRAGEFGQAGAATDGVQIAFLNVDVGEIFQTLGTNFQVANDYGLSVDVSARSGPGTETIHVVIYQGTIFGQGDLNATNIVSETTLTGGSGVVADQFNMFSLTATAAQVSTAAAVGQPIGIGFFGLNAGSGTTDFDLDNVRLDSTLVIPEPSTMLLAVLGLYGLGLRGWRRRS